MPLMIYIYIATISIIITDANMYANQNLINMIIIMISVVHALITLK